MVPGACHRPFAPAREARVRRHVRNDEQIHRARSESDPRTQNTSHARRRPLRLPAVQSDSHRTSYRAGVTRRLNPFTTKKVESTYNEHLVTVRSAPQSVPLCSVFVRATFL